MILCKVCLGTFSHNHIGCNADPCWWEINRMMYLMQQPVYDRLYHIMYIQFTGKCIVPNVLSVSGSWLWLLAISGGCPKNKHFGAFALCHGDFWPKPMWALMWSHWSRIRKLHVMLGSGILVTIGPLCIGISLGEWNILQNVIIIMCMVICFHPFQFTYYQ